MAKMSLLSLSGSVFIKTKLMKSPAEALWCTQTHVLVKTSKNNSRWQTERYSDNRNSQSLYTSKVILYYEKHPLGQRETSPGAKRNIPWGKETSVHG